MAARIALTLVLAPFLLDGRSVFLDSRSTAAPVLRRITTDPAQEGFPSWAPDGATLVFARTDRDRNAKTLGLWKASASGGDLAQLTAFVGEHPHWSGDGRYIVFDGDFCKSIKILSAEGGCPIRLAPEILIDRGGNPVWSPDATRVAFRAGEKLQVLDVGTGRIETAFHVNGAQALPCSWMPDGKTIIACVRNAKTREAHLWTVPLGDGQPEQLTLEEAGVCRYADVSPDGSLVAFAAMVGDSCNLWVMPAIGGRPVRLTSDCRYDDSPRWSPNGREIAFTSTRSGNFDVWVLEVDRREIQRKLEKLNFR